MANSIEGKGSAGDDRDTRDKPSRKARIAVPNRHYRRPAAVPTESRKTEAQVIPPPEPTGDQQRPAHLFKPGQSGNPLGRPKGSRNKLSENMLSDLATDWEENGANVLQKVRTEDPSTYLRVAFSILPRDMLISVQQEIPGGLSPDDYALLRSVIGLIKSAQVNASPSEVFTVIEDALRSHFAKPIPAKAEHLSANQQIISR